MISNVYNYLAANYAPKSSIRNNTHKRSELRDIYSTIVNLNRKSPLYMLNISEEGQKLALDIKSSALSLNYFLSDIAKSGDNHPAFLSRIAVSSDMDSASAEIISEDYSHLPDELTLKINQKAENQINEGWNMNPNGRGPYPGYYSFVIDIDDKIFEFQFNVPDSSKNLEIQNKLVSFINKADIGINAILQQDYDSNSNHVILEAHNNSVSSCFSVKDTSSPDSGKGISEFYGLNNIKQKQRNTSFEINGEAHISSTNYIVLNNCLKLNFKSVSSETNISYAPDNDAILGLVNDFMDSYNTIITSISESGIPQKSSFKLLHDMNDIVSYYNNRLESCGLIMSDDGIFQLDESLAIQAIHDGDMQKLFTENTGVMKRLMNTTKFISLNPMDYIDKTLVTYPNTIKPAFPNPYVTSIYSGMLYNYYC